MRRGLCLTILVAAAVAGLPSAALADPADPVAQIDETLNGRVFPQGAVYSFGFGCTSETSFIVSCVGSQPLGSLLDTTQAGTHTVSVTATDYEGRQSSASATYTVWDTTPPHVIFRVPADGATYAQGTDLKYDYSCEDDAGGLGIIACVTSFAPYPVPDYPLDTQHLGTFSFDVYAVDGQLNLTHQTITYTIADRTPPTITFSSPANNATYVLGQQVWASFSCDDGPDGSGLNGCKGDVASGTQLDTSALGTSLFTVTTSDRAGNVSRETHTYSVIYDFSGFASPAAPYPTATAVKAGEGVPLKFSLHGNQGTNIFASGSPNWSPCGPADAATSADGVLTYNASADRYTYLASSSKSWAGTCRDLTLTLGDGTTHRARFTFSK
jgi:hypothetical protein